MAVQIYESLIDVFPDDTTITSELLKICNEYKGEWIENIKEQINSLAQIKFANNPIANLHSILEMRSFNKFALENDEESILLQKLNNVLSDLKSLASENKEKEVDERLLLIEGLIKKVSSSYQELVNDGNERKDIFLQIFTAILRLIDSNVTQTGTLASILEGNIFLQL